MASKPQDDRVKAMRERAAALKRRPEEEATPAPSAPPAPAIPFESHFGIAALDVAVAGRIVERLPVALVAPEMRPGLRQPRLLPRPEELVVQGQPADAYRDIVAGLLDLGRSLAERQIQPIIVYPGASDEYPGARYLILVGHRRWTAAQLAHIDGLDAIVIDPPTAEERVQLQYAENEERADFTDMERAWALAQMRQALGDAPWEAVEGRFQMSRTRRQELLRLLAFTPEQQAQVARLRLRETQVRPLHQALRDAALSPQQVDALFDRFAQIASSHAGSRADASASAVDGPTIGRLVAKARRASLGAEASVAPWARALLDQLARTKRSVQSARRRLGTANEQEAAQIRDAVGQMVALLGELEDELLDERNH